MKASETLLEAQNITIGWPSRPLFNNVSFEVKNGSILAILGGSGCGKSTLLKHLIGLLQPSGGKILYKNQNIYTETLNYEKGVLFQNSALWSSLTLYENIALPLQLHRAFKKQNILRTVQFAIDLVGLNGFEEEYPANLSGGMRKRAGLARALASNPKILFLDEPSAGLDPPNVKKLDELILFLRNQLQVTVILVTHDLNSVFRVADELLFLDKKSGNIFIGTKDSYLKKYSNISSIKEFFS